MRHPRMSITLSPILVDAIELRKLALRIRECYGTVFGCVQRYCVYNM
jgi:hypothetical protein